MNLLASLSRHKHLIEPLEQRIAPALLVNGANLLGGSNPSTGETSIGGNSVTLVKVLGGEAIVWFDRGAIDAISVGPNTSLDIYGDVGTIVGNLTASGHLSDSDGNASNGLDGGVLLPNNIASITTHPLSGEAGSVGSIITGGSVSNLNISGNLEGVYAGNGAFFGGGGDPNLKSHVLTGTSVNVTLGVDVNPIAPGLQNSFVFAAGNAKTVESGASITNVKMGAAEELQMFAGNGADGTPAVQGHAATPGQAGGSITNVTVESAFVDSGYPAATTPSYALIAGSGGHGTAGGAGGSIQKIVEVSSTGKVEIIAGAGGTGLSKAGGAGGFIKGLDMQSDSAAYTVHAGKGGAGAPGGAGGSVAGVNFAGDAPSSGIIVHAPFTGGSVDDILLVDSGTGSMVIERNNGNGSGFTPVIQDSVTGLNTIASEGTTPVSAVAVDVNGDGLPDIVVAYKNTDNVGVYINQGGGIFYQQNFTNGSYTGDTLEATSTVLPYSPYKIAAANFTGDALPDIAVLATGGAQSVLLTLPNNDAGGFNAPSSVIQFAATAVDLTPANIQGKAYSDLIVGFKTGAIYSLLANGSTTGAPFDVVNSGVTVAGGIANLDYNFQDNQLLALNQQGSAVTIYTSNTAGALALGSTINLSTQPGVALVAHFVPELTTPIEPVEVLSSISSGARLDVWTLTSGSYAVSGSTQSTEPLKNFVPVIEGSNSGVAALGGSLGHFAFSESSGPFNDFSLPFSGKEVGIVAGDGGVGIDGAHVIAKGGAGGSISGMNIIAGDIQLTGGAGGGSGNGAAGAGGQIVDSPVLISVTGHGVQTILEADNTLLIVAGAGGTATGTAHTATGGAGGNVGGLNMSLLSGEIQVTAGDGGTGGGGAGGTGGMATALKSVDYAGDLSIQAGNGGDAAGGSGNGGTGGSILNLTHHLTLLDQTVESGYNVTLAAGTGGSSASALGAAGGSIGSVNLTLESAFESVNQPLFSPPTAHANVDSTVRVTMTAGNGGGGTTGGAGGSLKGINSTSVYDQQVIIAGPTPGQVISFAEINPVTAQLTAGNGGNGTMKVGGVGGSVSALTLVGISHFDPDAADPQAGQTPLVITSGNGGNGAAAGGAGGAILGVNSLNAQFSSPGTTTGGSNLTRTQLSGATLTSGRGGNGGTSNGGAGGIISNLSIGVETNYQSGALSVAGVPTASGGTLTILSGGGGNGGATGKGGAAGSVTSSTVGSADVLGNYGLLLKGGPGGSGTLGGGAGGSVTNIQLNAPQNPSITQNKGPSYDTLAALILGGNGGTATGATAVGGVGGSISQISQTKDVNSAINVIQAGNGGASVGTGGDGGSVSAVNTVGLIGQASDDGGNSFGAFQTDLAPGVFTALFPGGVPEGVFAGRGGAGATSGKAGAVTSITAAQIAAIGAAADSSGLFAAATKVANITAQVIAYDVNGNGLYDNASGTNQTAPDVAVPIDGFIFSLTTPTGVNTFNNTLLKGFTFA